MKRRGMTAVALLLCLLCARALAQAYTYGGSGSDALDELAVSGDGRIVMTGYTNSSDGTLASRTKTGRSGWVLCVDAQGNVLWSFCSRRGTHDIMSSPVCHEDGSVTVILEAEDDTGTKKELIRLSRDGEVMHRSIMCQTGGDVAYVMIPLQRFDEGYVLLELKEDATPLAYRLYDWDGQAVRELEGYDENGTVLAMADRHVIRIGNGTGTLYALDGEGNERRLTDVLEVGENNMLNARYDSLISLEDGGAAGCGWVLTDEGVRKGLISRWDAQGNLIFEMRMEIGRLWRLVKTADGFAAIAYPNETSGLDQSGSLAYGCPWELIRLNEQGVVYARQSLGMGASPYDANCALAALPDGSLAVVQNVQPDGEDWYTDVRLTVIPAK